MSDEFDTNYAILDQVEVANSSNNELLASLLELSIQEIEEIETERAFQLLGAAGEYDPFDPVQSEFRSMVNSGRFGLISDAKLRSALSAWESRLEDSQSMTNALNRRTDNLVGVLSRYGAASTLASRRYSIGAVATPQEVLVRARQDPEFVENAVILLMSRDLYVRDDISALRDSIDNFREVLASQ